MQARCADAPMVIDCKGGVRMYGSNAFREGVVTWRAIAAIAALLAMTGISEAAMTDDEKAVAELDTQYQAAVKINDAKTMDAILHDQMVLVVGNGTVYSKADLIEEARSATFVWEQQDEEPGSQTVRVWGDTAVVTAKLWLKGVSSGKPIDRKLWFSDTYVRTPAGWRYVFGQASLALPSD